MAQATLASSAPPSFEELRRRAEALVPRLRERAAKAEALRRLPDETVADLHRAGLFRMLQPARVGGSELPYTAMVELAAIIGSGCGSTAWVLNNLASHHWMLGYWPKEAQDEIWGPSPDTLIGSAFIFPGGRARKVEGGYRLSGRWPFSSGVDPSAWNMIGAVVPDEQTGASEHRVFLVPASDYSIIDTWYVAASPAPAARTWWSRTCSCRSIAPFPSRPARVGRTPAARSIPARSSACPGRAVRLRRRRRLAWHRPRRPRAICRRHPLQARHLYRAQPRGFLDPPGPCGGGGRAGRCGRGGDARDCEEAMDFAEAGADRRSRTSALAPRRRLCRAHVRKAVDISSPRPAAAPSTRQSAAARLPRHPRRQRPLSASTGTSTASITAASRSGCRRIPQHFRNRAGTMSHCQGTPPCPIRPPPSRRRRSTRAISATRSATFATGVTIITPAAATAACTADREFLSVGVADPPLVLWSTRSTRRACRRFRKLAFRRQRPGADRSAVEAVRRRA